MKKLWVKLEETKRMRSIINVDDISIIDDLVRELFSIISFVNTCGYDKDGALLILWNLFIEENKEIIKLQGLQELYKWFLEELKC
nr:MAG TPA: hypothetical protein [Caudoviricetes sp.]